MTEQDQIRAIAKLDGWVTPALGCVTTPKHKWTNKNDGCCYAECPPYLTSWDAIVPVIEKQSGEMKDEIMVIIENRATFHPLLATPRQICEALLRATGRWKE